MGAMLSAEDIKKIVVELRAVGTDTQYVEAKRAKSNAPERLWMGLTAFSNTPGQGGGTVLLGVDEQNGFEISGVVDAAKVQDAVAAHCRDVRPTLRPSMYPVDVDGKIVIVVEVPELPDHEKPAYREKTGLPRGACQRVADQNQHLDDYEVQQFYAGRRRLVDDEEPIAGCTIADLDAELVQAFADHLRSDDPERLGGVANEEILVRRRAVTKSGDVTMAGLLAFGEDPSAFIPQMSVEFVYWPTNTKGEQADDGTRFVDNKRFSGPLPYLYPAVAARLKRHLGTGARIDTHRTDVPEYPDVVLREALLNAFVHRDLSPQAQSMPVTVHLFPNRIEITNPGGLYQVGLDEFGRPSGRSTRNARLMQILEDLPRPNGDGMVVDNRGSGIPTIVAELHKAGLHQPTFRNRISSFQLVFPRGSLIDRATLKWITDNCPKNLTASQRTVAALLYNGERINNERYRAETLVDSRVATQELGELVAAEIAESRSGGRGHHYVLHSKHSTAGANGAAQAATPANDGNSHQEPNSHHEGDDGNSPALASPSVELRRQRVREAVEEDPHVTAAELAKRESVSVPTIERDLRALRTSGALGPRRPGPRPRG